MKKNKIIFLAITALVFACKPSTKSSSEKLPATVSNVAEIQKLITNKTWQVIDVAKITGSRPSAFAKPITPADNITTPNVDDLKWFSEMKGLEDTTDFKLKFYKENFDFAAFFILWEANAVN